MSKKITKTLTSALTSIASGLQTGRKMKSSPSSLRRRSMRRPSFFYRPNTVNRTLSRALPAAYATHVRPRFNILSRGINSVRVSGCDLVYPIADSVPSSVFSAASVFSVIPANPAYWSGTKIAQFAPAYMNYRPLALTFSYIPQVAVTQAGTVFMGTLWNGAPATEDIQQSLFTSNGGCLTQCYVPCDTTVTLGSNLPQNLFTLAGSLSTETNPFLFIAGMRPGGVIPGYFYVTYTYEFKNPIGTSWKFFRSTPQEVGLNPGSSDDNTSLVVLTRNRSGSDVPVGTICDVESDGVYYSGTKLQLEPNTYVIYFSCTNIFDISTPLAGSADALVLSGKVSPSLDENAVTIPLAKLQSVQTGQPILPVEKDGVTYDKIVALRSFPSGIRVEQLDLTSSGLYLNSGDRFTYLKPNASEPTTCARIIDTTKKVVATVGAGILAASALTDFYYIATNLFPTKYFAQAQQQPSFANLQAPQGRSSSSSSSSSSVSDEDQK